jgi:hypothetical protein
MYCTECLKDREYREQRKINKKIEKEIKKDKKTLDKDLKILMLGKIHILNFSRRKVFFNLRYY